ncbi:DUF3540 domain-containing protein [Burkholderia ubonensis]|uniref:DUF3540 domain-containing protein n=2 Tax=Burkholderia ubonensis TaxID=101571 RepID=UPI0007575CF6|nr:DUF3540 domain-containing protein [Burkholderia ubonensis]KVQ20004.1 hypothetical protein WJ98_17980 [Burkholderia ubonensis]
MTVLQSNRTSATSTYGGDDGSSAPMAKLLKRPDAAMSDGRMTMGRIGAAATDGAWWVVMETNDPVLAHVAVSCVVKPRCGDLVQLYRAPVGCWVMAILERSDETSGVVLDFGQDSVRLQARDIHVQASDRLNLDAVIFESRANVITQAAKERHAHVGGTDVTHAGNTFIHTERHIGLNAKSAALKSESLLKIDAGQIHMG